MADLIKLGEKLSKEGPFKSEGTPRRVRGLLGGEWVFDTVGAIYVWEHKFYPYFYIPLKEFKGGAITPTSPNSEASQTTGFYLATLTTTTKASTDRVLIFTSPDSLQDLVRIEHARISWFAEDEKLLGPHPKDPYKRIETLPTSRTVRIEVDGQVVVESSQNVFLFETGLRPRYYLNAADVKWRFLRESEMESYCPYKGMANYYDLVVGGKEIKDAVWYYEYPTSESALVAGRLCFYNEKVDVFIDGVREEKYQDARL